MLGFFLILWLVLVVAEIAFVWRKSSQTAGFILGWMAALTISHWFGALAYWVPWSHLPAEYWTETGFVVSTLGLASLFVGARVVAPLIPMLRRIQAGDVTPPHVAARLPYGYALVGVALLLVVNPIAGDLPTMTAVVSTGPSFMMIGLGLMIWRLAQKGSTVGVAALVLWMLFFPTITFALTENVIRIALLILIVCCFAASFYRPRWHVALAAVIVIYGGMSLGLTYLQVRSEVKLDLRESSLIGKFERVARMAEEIEFFNLNPNQLELIDSRMNQSVLVGMADEYMSSGMEEYAKGETIGMAVLALVPRFLWPDKPVEAGSMNLASRFTGMEVAEHTSIGLGPILEWYINFGTVGVILGMMVFGVAVRALDIAARKRIEAKNLTGFALAFGPTLVFVQAEGSFVGVSASMATTAILVWAVNRFIPVIYKVKSSPALVAMDRK